MLRVLTTGDRLARLPSTLAGGRSAGVLLLSFLATFSQRRRSWDVPLEPQIVGRATCASRGDEEKRINKGLCTVRESNRSHPEVFVTVPVVGLYSEVCNHANTCVSCEAGMQHAIAAAFGIPRWDRKEQEGERLPLFKYVYVHSKQYAFCLVSSLVQGNGCEWSLCWPWCQPRGATT